MARALRTSADRARFPRPSVIPCPLPRPGRPSYYEHASAVGRTPPRDGLCLAAAAPRGFFPRAAPPVRGLPHNTPSTQARDELGIELRSFYRTSPPAADRWVHRARYEVRFSASFAVARAAVLRRASTHRLDPAARWPAPELTAEPTSGPRREKHPPETPSTRPAPKNAGETRRQGEAGPRARAEVQGRRREGVRQARAERRAARGRVGGHDGVRGPCPF